MTDSKENGQATGLRQVYIDALHQHAISLIWLGYLRMTPQNLADAEEDDITGELVREMDEVLQLEDAPAWVEHYSVSEQVRSHTPGRLGKRRPIVDVEFSRNSRGLRPRLRFEAKRLRQVSDIKSYIGLEGLGAFLDLHYSRIHNEVGMIGYVQCEVDPPWERQLENELVPPKHRITPDGKWTRLEAESNGHESYLTIHTDADGVAVRITHVLLTFLKN